MTNPSSSSRLSMRTSWMYGAIVAIFCCWVLSLPLFPTQDGPMHRYYIHVLASLLRHESTFSMYLLRHPFPPYVTHYATLLLISKVCSYDLAEKCFVCLCLACFAYGLRLCARVAGPGGNWISLLVAPLLLPWTLMMGFFNFYLGTGMFLFAVAFWRMASLRRKAWWTAFAATVAVLTFTHPVPLLLLLAVCAVDLTMSGLYAPAGCLRSNYQRLLALLFVLAAFLFPASLLGRQQVHSAFAGFGVHPRFISTMLLLMGMSPYNTRSADLWINAYRLTLYLLLLFCVVSGVRAMRRNLATRDVAARDLGLGSTFLVCTLLLGLGLLVLPNSINGSLYFATRLIPMLWIGAMMAASASQQLPRAQVLMAAAAWCVVVTLVPAEIYMRPAAVDLKAEEMQELPQQAQGVLLIGYGLADYVRFHHQLAFNPYQWGTVLAAVSHNDIVLDSPWMDLNITPIAPVPGSPLMIDDITDSPFNRTNPPARYGRSLPASKEHATVARSSFVVYAGRPQELARGLSDQFDPDEAARFQCSEHGWNLVCIAGANF